MSITSCCAPKDLEMSQDAPEGYAADGGPQVEMSSEVVAEVIAAGILARYGSISLNAIVAGTLFQHTCQNQMLEEFASELPAMYRVRRLTIYQRHQTARPRHRRRCSRMRHRSCSGCSLSAHALSLSPRLGEARDSPPCIQTQASSRDYCPPCRSGSSQPWRCSRGPCVAPSGCRS